MIYYISITKSNIIMMFIGLALMLLTLLTLMSGVGLMVFGGPEMNKKYATKLMGIRVTLQFLSVAFVLAYFYNLI